MKQTRKAILATLLAATTAITLTACDTTPTETAEDTTVITVGVVGEYNLQWDIINDLLAEDGIQVELVKFSDYAVPNRALNDGEIDLNAFQHIAYLNNDIANNGYEIEPIADTIIAPLAIFHNKDKISSIEDIKDGDSIAIPSDLTNGGRALKLLEEAGLITCDPEKGFIPTVADITEYHVDIDIVEVESATLASILPDHTAAIINGGNAYTAGLHPIEDTIYTENVNPDENAAVPELVNVIVARADEVDREAYQKIVEAYHTDEVKQALGDSYAGAFLPVW